MMNSFSESIQFFPKFPEVDFQKPEIKWIEEGHQDQVFEFIPQHHKRIFIFMRYAACRENEARGLLWESVHLEAKNPYFVLATVMGRKGNLKPNTKTKRARPLPVIPELLDVLRKPSEQLINIKFVFSNRGKPYGENAIRKIWKGANIKANKKYGTPLINPYNGLKHSFGCQRLNDGFAMTEVQAVMGHTDIRTTQRYVEYVTSKLSDVMRGKVVRIENISKTGDN
jgi:integrase